MLKGFFSSFKVFVSGATKQQIESVAKKLDLSSEEVVKLANEADPTPEKKFEAWILRQMAAKLIRLPEDAHRVEKTLRGFIVYSRKHRLEHTDINQYKTIHTLEEELEALKFDMGVSEPLTEEEIRSYPGVHVFEDFSFDDLVLVSVSEVRSLEKLGLGTQWCTRGDYERSSYAAKYLSESNTGRLFILFEKKNKSGHEVLMPKYQFTDDFNQFMDVKDRPAMRDVPSDLLEEIVDVVGDVGMQAQYVLNVSMDFDKFPHPEDPVEIERVRGVVKDYLHRLTDYSELNNSFVWELALEFGIEDEIFDYTVCFDSPDETIYYCLGISKKRNEALEDYLFRLPSLVDINAEAVKSYFDTFILSEIRENQQQLEKDPESFDPDDKEHPDQILQRWLNVFLHIATIDRRSVTASRVLLQMLEKYRPEGWIEAHDVLKKHPKVWEEYRKWLQEHGTILDIWDHFERERSQQ